MRATSLSLAALALCGLTAVSTAQNAAKVDIRGAIAKATPTKNAKILGTILIDGKVEKGVTQYDKAFVKITPETKIEWLAGKTKKKATFEDLKVGAKVQAKFVGPVAESYPVQATAGEILILEAAKEK